MSEVSPRFSLPLLQAGQAQKEIIHNEALLALEVIGQAVAETAGDNLAPASPREGVSWLVGSSPSGAWAGHADALAFWTAGGWRFVAPVEGMQIVIKSSGLTARRGSAAWVIGDVTAAKLLIGGYKIVGPRQPAIPAPSGGATVDADARTAIAAMLAAMREHGLIATS